jgi:hypothetical protein
MPRQEFVPVADPFTDFWAKETGASKIGEKPDSRVLLDPKVRMEKPKIEMATADKAKSNRIKRVVWWCNLFRGKPRYGTKKGIHGSMDGTGTFPAPTTFGDAEIPH